jgi:hypothetical protein
MGRFVLVCLFAVGICSLQSGCCGCCRAMFAGMAARPAVVVNVPAPQNPPPVFEAPPPNPEPPVNQPPRDQVNPPPNNPPPNNPPPNQPPPGAPRAYVYSQSTGQFKQGDELLGIGYSGRGAAKNNAGMESQKKLGPIPAGEYKITAKRKDAKNGGVPYIALLPMPGNNAAGRFPGESFRIYLDANPPDTASGSGIVLPRDAFEKINPAGFPTLKVVP